MIFRRLLSLLFKLGIYKKHFKLTWVDDIISTNAYYSTPHWSVRSKNKRKISEAFAVLLLQAKVKPMDEVSLVVFTNHRLDIDNHGIQNKILIDTMKGKYLKDDSKKTYVSTHTVYDSSLPKNTTEYHLIGR